MSAYASLSEKRKQQIRDSVARNNAKTRAMPPAGAAAWKIRTRLKGAPDPYSPDQRQRAEDLRARLDALQAEAEALHAEVLDRLQAEAADNPDAAALFGAVATAKVLRLDFLF